MTHPVIHLRDKVLENIGGDIIHRNDTGPSIKMSIDPHTYEKYGNIDVEVDVCLNRMPDREAIQRLRYKQIYINSVEPFGSNQDGYEWVTFHQIACKTDEPVPDGCTIYDNMDLETAESLGKDGEKRSRHTLAPIPA
ncbi:MAG: hypothetical protein MPK62_01475 [Alphaproteobacteria bacterium]|nr:hypothetical protein [Alphaproteobacteria bacterium]MDA8029805.1 hypothetical protein [Alphaproteobacteria bacterium]